MFRLYPRLACAIALTLASSVGHAADAPAYTVLDLGVLGGTSSAARGINNFGQVVGDITVARATPHAFIWSAGTMTDLAGTIGGTSNQAFDINDSGVIVGQAQLAVGQRAFAYNTNTSQLNNALLSEGDTSLAQAVNNNGLVAGRSNTTIVIGTNPFLTYRGFRWTPGADPTALEPLVNDKASADAALGINQAGVIVGYSTDPTNLSHGIAWLSANGLVQLLPGSGHTASAAAGINDSGFIAGTVDNMRAATWQLNSSTLAGDALTAVVLDPSRTDALDRVFGINNVGDVVGLGALGNDPLTINRAVLWKGKKAIDLTGSVVNLADAGFSQLSVAYAINDQGWIVGQGLAADNSFHAFLLTPVPVPEPQTWALLLAGLAGIGWLRRASARR
jgi:probable HAF family extracellular repeat protein